VRKKDDDYIAFVTTGRLRRTFSLERHVQQLFWE